MDAAKSLIPSELIDFLLNVALSQEVQKAFYSLIHDRRISKYHLPEGIIVIGAGNRTEDAAIVKPMSSAINRGGHGQLRANASNWLEWVIRLNLNLGCQIGCWGATYMPKYT
jgi:hypothetical protein